MVMVFFAGYAVGAASLAVAAAVMDARKRGKAMRKELERQKLERWHREVYAPGFEFIELKKEKFK